MSLDPHEANRLLQEAMDKLETKVRIDSVREDINDRKTVVLSFSQKGFGFGEIAIVQTKEGVFIDDEHMGIKGVMHFVAALLSSAILSSEADPEKHRKYSENMPRRCGDHCTLKCDTLDRSATLFTKPVAASELQEAAESLLRSSEGWFGSEFNGAPPEIATAATTFRKLLASPAQRTKAEIERDDAKGELDDCMTLLGIGDHTTVEEGIIALQNSLGDAQTRIAELEEKLPLIEREASRLRHERDNIRSELEYEIARLRNQQAAIKRGW